MNDRESTLHRFEEGDDLRDAIQEAAGEEWSVLGIIVAGEDDDGTMFVNVIRRRIGSEGQLVIRDGYAAVDLASEDPVKWTDNYVDRRIQGSVLDSLVRTYAAINHGGATADDPQLRDARREDDDEEDPEVLTTPLDDLRDDREDDVEVGEPEKESAKESVEQDEDPATVQCEECGREIAREEADNFGGGSFGDLWVHASGCPDDEDDEVDQ